MKQRVVLTAWFCILYFLQALKTWKHNRFDAYRPNTHAVAMRSLPPGTNGEVATEKLLTVINDDKERVASICTAHLAAMWLDAAEVCNLTYKCPFDSRVRQPCRKLSDITVAWTECAGSKNAKRIAFIFDYYGSVVHQRALGTTLQTATASEVLRRMGIIFDVAHLKGGSKNCVRQQFSYCSQNQKYNLLRGGYQKHRVSVNLGLGNQQTKKNYKRPKHIFFVYREERERPGMKVIETVR